MSLQGRLICWFLRRRFLPATRGPVDVARVRVQTGKRVWLPPVPKGWQLREQYRAAGASDAPGAPPSGEWLVREGGAPRTILYLHGGGWSLGSLATYEPFCRSLANATGQIVIWVEYRLAPEAPYPAALDDTLAAWRWVQNNHGELGANPARISIGGDSAGGNLAAVAALALRGETGIQPWRQVLLYPCLDMSASLASHRRLAEGYLLTAPLYAWYRDNYAPAGIARDDWRLSPLFADDLGGLPPAVLLYAGFDPLRDEAAAYAMKLTLAGVPVETLYFADMIHGFLTMGGAIPAAQAAVTRIAEALSVLES